MKTTNINSTSPPLGRTKKAGSVERPSPILTGTGGIGRKSNLSCAKRTQWERGSLQPWEEEARHNIKINT